MITTWLDEVTSTMDEGRALAMQGAAHGTVIAARSQTAGRGRSGRAWVSRRGNLHATVLLRPAIPAHRAPELSFVVALAVAAAVDDLAGPGTALKWPNDVLRDGAKLAGILLERLEDGAVLAGIGLNVRHVPEDAPYAVTSLALAGCTTTTDAALDATLFRLEGELAAWQGAGFGPVLERWAARGPAIGSALHVRLPDGLLSGRFAGLSPNGALLIETLAGLRTLVAGEVMLESALV